MKILISAQELCKDVKSPIKINDIKLEHKNMCNQISKKNENLNHN
jgi:hypothetical protein